MVRSTHVFSGTGAPDSYRQAHGLLATISESPSLLASEGQGPLLRGGQNKNIGNTAPHLEDYPYYNVKAILLGALVGVGDSSVDPPLLLFNVI